MCVLLDWQNRDAKKHKTWSILATKIARLSTVFALLLRVKRAIFVLGTVWKRYHFDKN